MAIKALRLSKTKILERTKLYQVERPHDFEVEEVQEDGSRDRVILEYRLEQDELGYFAKEYRPDNIPKTGAKMADITAVILNHVQKCGRWHLYDMKGEVAGEDTVCKLCNQWNAGFQYLQQNILVHVSGYSMVSDLGVFARSYDEERMQRIRDEYKELCDEIEAGSLNMTLAQRKKRLDIASCRGIVKASQAILDRTFQPDSGKDAYNIHIRLLNKENNQVYKINFPV